MRISDSEFDSIIKRAVRSVLREQLEESESDIQDQFADQIKMRGVKAPPEKKSDKDSDDKDTDEAEDEEGEDKDKEDKKAEKKPEDKPKSDKKPDDKSKPQIKIDLVLPDSIKPEDIQKKLNLLRAGKSLKDEDTKKRFDTYFASLSAPQKVALQGFLDGLTQVILGDTPGPDAKNPSDSPYNVKMDADPEQESENEPAPKKSTPKKPTGSATPSGSDTPIVVGESANKLEYMRLVRKNAV